MSKVKPLWDGEWYSSIPINVDYKESEMRYAKGLADHQRKIAMPLDEWHHILIFIDGVKEMDKIAVTYIPHENPSDSRALLIGALLFLFGIVQIIFGFGSLLTTGMTAVTLFAFFFGAMVATAGLVSWIFGIKEN